MTAKEKRVVLQAEKDDPKFYCHYLDAKITKRRLERICAVLEVKVPDSYQKTSFAELSASLQEQRPDLQRGRAWNMLRASLMAFDLTDWRSYMKAIVWSLLGSAYVPASLGAHYGMNVAAYFQNNKNMASGQALYALQRQEARQILRRSSSRRSSRKNRSCRKNSSCRRR